MAQDSNQTPIDPGPKRRWRLMLAVVAAVAAIVLAAVAVFAVAGSGDDVTDPGDESSPSQTEPLEEPPEGDELKLADSGLSVYEVDGLPDALSYGVVLENTSDDHVAELLTVSVEVVDGDGNVVRAGDEATQQHEVTVVMPGERIGVGDSFNVGDDDLDASDIKLDVDIGTAQWWLAEDSDHAAVYADSVAVSDNGDDSWVELTFEVTSEYSQTLDDARTYAIFRDSEGAIVGGAPPLDSQAFSPGKSEGELDVQDSLPGAADETQTEIYVLPN